jgi:hypothetical protein
LIEDFYNQTLYRIHDPKGLPGCFEITGSEMVKMTTDDEVVLRLAEAHKYNAENWGVYWTVNKFNGARKKENLEKIRAWFVECDGNNKPQMLKKLKSKLPPSMIIESKAGFHAYWFASGAVNVEAYSDILGYRLIPFYGADFKARDLSRILRVPDYFHCKNPTEKFLVKLVHLDESLVYSEADILEAYPLRQKEVRAVEIRETFRKEFNVGGKTDLWERIFSLDCEEALLRLSGTDAVNGERFEFRKNGAGTKQIIINGKSTGCWIDSSRRIGSADRGGPTIFQWINWYHRDKNKSYEYLKQYFAELFT